MIHGDAETGGTARIVVVDGASPDGGVPRASGAPARPVPFPDADARARAAARGGTSAAEERLRAFLAKEEERRMALGLCFRPGQGNCQYEYVCVRCPYLQVDPERMSVLVEMEVDALRRLRVAEDEGWTGEVRAIEDTLSKITEKKAQLRQARDE